MLHGDTTPDGCTPEEVQQAQVAGVTVYTEFLELHLQGEGITSQNSSEVIETVEQHGRTAINQRSNNIPETSSDSLSRWKEEGKRLHKLALDFQESVERKKVKQQAIRVTDEVDGIGKDEFWALMEGFFPENRRVTPYSIVVLFTFCSDVIVLAVKKSAGDLFSKFLDWALAYIMDKVCTWVARNGGWDTVLSQPWTYVYIAAAVVVTGVVLYAGYRLIKGTIGFPPKK